LLRCPFNCRRFGWLSWIVRRRFRPLALLWLLAAVALQAVLRFLLDADAPSEPGMRVAAVLMSAASLAVTALGGGPALEQ